MKKNDNSSNKQYVFFKEVDHITGYDINTISINESDDKLFYNVTVKKGRGIQELIIQKDNCIVGMHRVNEETWVDAMGNEYELIEIDMFENVILTNEKISSNSDDEEYNKDIINALIQGADEYDETTNTINYKEIIRKSIDRLPYDSEKYEEDYLDIEKEAYYLSELAELYSTTKKKLIEKLKFNSIDIHILLCMLEDVAYVTNVELWLRRLKEPSKSYISLFSANKIDALRQKVCDLTDFEIFVLYTHLRHCLLYDFSDNGIMYANYYEAYIAL